MLMHVCVEATKPPSKSYAKCDVTKTLKKFDVIKLKR